MNLLQGETCIKSIILDLRNTVGQVDLLQPGSEEGPSANLGDAARKVDMLQFITTDERTRLDFRDAGRNDNRL